MTTTTMPALLSHFPLRDARLCVECDTVFQLAPLCPSCSGGSWITLAYALRDTGEVALPVIDCFSMVEVDHAR